MAWQCTHKSCIWWLKFKDTPPEVPLNFTKNKTVAMQMV